MKRSLIITLALIAAIAVPLCASSIWARGLGVLGLGGGAVAGGDDYSDILLFNRMESLTLSTGDCYGADSTMAPSGTTPSISSGAAKNGIYGANYTTTTSSSPQHVLSVTSEDIVSGTAGRVGMWVRVNTWSNFATLFVIQQSVTDRIGIDIRNTDELRLTARTGGVDKTLDSAAANLTTGVWYFIEAAYDAGSAGTGYLEIFVNGVSVGSATNLTYSAISPTSFLIGSFTAVTNLNMDIDHIIVSSDKSRDLYADLSSTESCPRN